MAENIKEALEYAVELDNQKEVIFEEGGKASSTLIHFK